MSKNLILLFIAIFISLSFSTHAQNVKGKITDSVSGAPLIGASVLLQSNTDTQLKKGVSTNTEGNFVISVLPGTYTLKINYIGYKNYSKVVKVENNDLDLGKILLPSESLNLKEIRVEQRLSRGTQKGDTSEYNANAYKTTKDASTEDLIKKMPSITTENGTIKAQGEDVKKVLVDGKPFFGNDPNAALKNLPAEVVDKIQIYDKLSDQAQFTGFDNGSGEKTINIITKPNRRNGSFGKLYAGYGTDNRYNAGGNINFFNNNRRISILGLSNNVNQQNFSTEDLVGALGGGGSMRHGNRGPRSAQNNRNSYYRPSGPMSNFLVGSQDGIANTNAFGINYSDSIGKKLYVNGSYFFNHSDNNSETLIDRTYLTGQEHFSLYKESSQAESINLNHRMNLRMEYLIDTMNSLIFTPSFSFQNSKLNSNILGNNFLSDASIANTSTRSNYLDSSHAFNLSGNLLFRHKFKLPGRTISLNIDGSLNNSQGDNSLNYITSVEDVDSISRQISNSEGRGVSINPELNYTEPLGKNSQLLLSYQVSHSENNMDRFTYTPTSPINNDFTVLDTSLSSKFNTILNSMETGVNYRYSKNILNLNFGVNYRETKMESWQNMPYTDTVTQRFQNFLPTASINLKFTKNKNLRLVYRSRVNTPSATQLQSTVNNSNPLMISSGNPDLVQAFTHMVFTRFGIGQPHAGKNFFVFAYGTATQNYVGNSSIIARNDTTLANGLRLLQGAQYTKPVNLDGYVMGRAFLVYGLPFDFLKSNLNLRMGMSFQRAPGLINGILNMSNTASFTPGLSLSSNISDKIDFNIYYNTYFNQVHNSLRKELDDNYFNQDISFNLNWTTWKGITITTDITDVLYTGLASEYNQHFLQWNMSLGKKILKNQNAEIRLSAFDILDQNKNINRNVTETYIEDVQTNVLQRYFLGSFIYNLRNFKESKPIKY